MSDTLCYLVALLVCYWFWVGVWVALFRSPLVPDLMEWKVTHDPMTHKDVETWLTNQAKFGWLRLWTCIHCQSFWVSFFFALSAAIMLACFLHPVYLLVFPLGALPIYPFSLFTLAKLWKL
jgi:hypothetical protein